jgi:hypothetical protein
METLVEIIVHVFVSGGLVQKSCQIYRVRGPPFLGFLIMFFFFFCIFLDSLFPFIKKKKKHSQDTSVFATLGSSPV